MEVGFPAQEVIRIYCQAWLHLKDQYLMVLCLSPFVVLMGSAIAISLRIHNLWARQFLGRILSLQSIFISLCVIISLCITRVDVVIVPSPLATLNLHEVDGALTKQNCTVGRQHHFLMPHRPMCMYLPWLMEKRIETKERFNDFQGA